LSRVLMNSAAVKNPGIIDEAVKQFGSDTITIVFIHYILH